MAMAARNSPVAPIERATQRLVVLTSGDGDKRFRDAQKRKRAIAVSALRMQDELRNILEASGITQEDLDNLAREQMQEEEKTDDSSAGN